MVGRPLPPAIDPECQHSMRAIIDMINSYDWKSL
jgi:hypothetical protein